MTFQTAVFQQQGSGVPGELYVDYPRRAQSFTMFNSGHPEYNIVGQTCYTITSPGFAQAGNGGTLGFAGFLFNPKVYSLQGTVAGTLNPTMVLPNYTQGEFITEGSIWVNLPNTANIGDLIVYDNTTGAIASITPSTSLGSGRTFANAVVAYQNVTVAGLAIIAINPLLPTPTP